MRDIELLEEGLGLMGLGMGFVFIFLTVLVFTTTLMSLTLRRFAPKPAKLVAAGIHCPQAPSGQEYELKAVMGAAIHHYHQRHRR